MSLFKKNIVLLSSILLLFSAFNLSGQNNDGDWKSKIKNLKGSVKSITISTDDGDLTLNGDEAVKLLEYLKKKKKFAYKLKLDDNEDDENVFLIDSDFDDRGEEEIEKRMTWVSEFGDDSTDTDVEKKIKVKIEDGEKIVTLTTIENGEKTVDTYRGEEAEEFLKKSDGDNFRIKMMKNGKHRNLMFFGDGTHKKAMKFRIQCRDKEDDADRNVEVEEKDGKIKVVVTEMKDGKEEIKTYEGEDAEKYLEEHGEYDSDFGDIDGNNKTILIEKCDKDSSNNCSKKIIKKKIQIRKETKKNIDK